MNNETKILIKNGKHIEYFNNDINIDYEEFYVNNKLHRDPSEGPAKIYYNLNGSIVSEYYYVNNELHRDFSEGPAIISYYKDINGNIGYECYYQHNKYHRCDGPAYISYDINGVITSERYFINGIEYADDLQYCVAVGCYLGGE